MTFDENNKAIYLQIADRICDDIMYGKYPPDTRIPSVREYAASVEVNANTVMRSYERLTNKGLIFQKRGIGFFVSPDARQKIIHEKSDDLMKRQLPPLFNLMRYMNITPEDLSRAYAEYLKTEKTEKTQDAG